MNAVGTTLSPVCPTSFPLPDRAGHKKQGGAQHCAYILDPKRDNEAGGVNRLLHWWWTRRDLNPRPLGCEPNALLRRIERQITTGFTKNKKDNKEYDQEKQIVLMVRCMASFSKILGLSWAYLQQCMERSACITITSLIY